MKGTAYHPGRITKWGMGAALVLVVLILLISMGSNLLLGVRFYLAGSQSGLLVDDLRALAEYPPQRVARYLESSSPKWRTIACQVLAAQSVNKRDANWRGIGPALARALLQDEEKELRTSAQRALDRIPELSQEDASAILLLLEKTGTGEAGYETVRIIGTKCPDAAPQLRGVLLQLAQSNGSNDRIEALRLLVEFFPDEPCLTSLLREILTEGQVGSASLVRQMRRFVEARPELLSQWLEGDHFEKLLALNGLASGTAKLNPELLHHAETVAEEFLVSGESEAEETALGFLRKSPNGGHILVSAAKQARAELRVQILDFLSKIAWDSYYGEIGGFQFTKDEADALIQMLGDPDAIVQLAAAKVINPGIPPDQKGQKAFLDPAHAPAFGRLLDNPGGELDWLALNFFQRITPFEASDIPRIVAAVRRDKGTWQAHQAFVDLLNRFPEHPETQALALDLTKAGRFERLALSTFFDDADPRNTQTRILALEIVRGSQNDIFAVTAGRYLLRSGTPAEEILAETTRRYRQRQASAAAGPQVGAAGLSSASLQTILSPAAREDVELAKLLLAAALKLGRTEDKPLVREVMAKQLLPFTWLTGSWPNDLPSRETVAELLGAKALADCERESMRQLLNQKVFANAVPVSIDELARFTQQLCQEAVFTEEATEGIARCLASNDAAVRIRGLSFLATARPSSAPLSEAAKAALDDPNQRVCIAAADALGALGTKDPNVLDKLRRMVDRSRPGVIRAAGLRSLATLAPNDPDTTALVNSLQNDPDLSVRSAAKQAAKTLAQSPKPR